LSAGANDVRHGVVMDAAIDFDTKFQPTRLPNFRKQFDLFQGRRDERLATESRVHAHYQHMMNQRKDLIEGVNGSRGINDDTRFASVRGDETEAAVEMDTGFLVYRNPIGPGFGERGNEFIRPFNHEVTIERHFQDFAK